jgi:hypothetical protein
LQRQEHFFLVGIRRETREWKRRISQPGTGAYGRKQTARVHIRFVQPSPRATGLEIMGCCDARPSAFASEMALGIGDLPLHFPLVRTGPERSLFVAKGIVHGGGGRRLNEGSRRRAGSEVCRYRPRAGRTAVLAVYGMPRPPEKSPAMHCRSAQYCRDRNHFSWLALRPASSTTRPSRQGEILRDAVIVGRANPQLSMMISRIVLARTTKYGYDRSVLRILL